MEQEQPNPNNANMDQDEQDIPEQVNQGEQDATPIQGVQGPLPIYGQELSFLSQFQNFFTHQNVVDQEDDSLA